MANADMTRSGTYAEWVRRMLRRARGSGGRIATLFDSSVPEPRELVTRLVARGFEMPVTDRYTSAFIGGNPHVVAHLARRYGVSADRILCTTGATGALSILYRSLVGPGQRVLVESPGFDLFDILATSVGIPVDHFARTGENFEVDVDAVRERLRPETRLVILSNLHNPSGHQTPVETLAALARLAEDRDIHVIVDEVYLGYADGAGAPPPAATLSDRLISISSLTKIYGLSTLRCGWIVGDRDVLAPVRALLEQVEFNVSNLAHAVAALVMDEAPVFDDYWRSALASNRPIVEAAIACWTGEGLIAGQLPASGCIAFPRLIGIDDAVQFSDWLCERHGVIVAPGDYFGAPGHIRIGFAQAQADLEYALDALGEGLRAYRPVSRAKSLAAG